MRQNSISTGDRRGRGLRSLRARVLLLASCVVLLLLLTAGVLISVIRSTHATLLANAGRHLDAVAGNLARAYEGRTERSLSLDSMAAQQPPLPAPPALQPPGDLRLPEPLPPPGPPPGRQSYDPLSALTTQVLASEQGIEGGFFRTDTGALGGYAFPTHEGPGPTKEMPAREQPAIAALARSAVEQRIAQHLRFDGPHDAVLFVALPLCESLHCAASPPGAVWLMQRLPGAEMERRRSLLWSALAFGTMALLIGVLAYAVLAEVNGSVRLLLRRLSALETDLSPRAPDTPLPRMAEFREVLDGIDQLAATVAERMSSERAMEARLRHNARLAALGQFAAGVAHELRNPLATIRLRTQMSQRTAGEPAVLHNSEIVLAEIDRLDGIIGRLLTFARPTHLHTSLIDVGDLCHTAVAAWSARAELTGCQFHCHAASNLYTQGDASRLRQVLDNLIQNAVEAIREDRGTMKSEAGTPEHRIEVTAEAVGSKIRIAVADSGPGLPPEVVTRAMDPFFTTRAGGTGLGLSIAHEIVQAHGGELSLGNGPHGNGQRSGAVAEITLPQTNAAARREESSHG